MCPRCGTPVADQQWGQSPYAPVGGFGQGASAGDAGAWKSPQFAQPPQFSASDLISPDSLPDWMRQGPEAAPSAAWPPSGQQRSPQPPVAPQGPSSPGWGGASPARQGAPLESIQTVRQPVAGSFNAGSNQPAPQGYPPTEWRQAPMPQAPMPPYDQQYAPAPPTPAYPPNPVNPGYPGYPNGAPAQPGYPPYPQGMYQQAPAPQQYGSAQQGFAPPSAFPPVEQAGMYAAPPQVSGMGARGLVDQTALPTWLAGASPQGQQPGQSQGMQARSLVDEQALPEWLRKQPDERPRPPVVGWLGASAAEEPLPSWMSPAIPDMPPGSLQPGGAPVGGLPQNGYTPQAPMPPAINLWQAPAYGVAAPPVSEDLALPDWLQAQAVAQPSAGAGPVGASGASGAGPGGAPSANPQYQWQQERPSFDAPPSAAAAFHSGEPEAPSTMRTPNAPVWDLEPYADETGIGGDQGWDTSEQWDGGQGNAVDDGWEDPGVRGAPRKAPLAPDEMPPWLRSESKDGSRQVYGTGGSAERDGRQRGAVDRDVQPKRGSMRDSHGWDDERGWDDESGDWDDQRAGSDDRDHAGWDNGYGAAPMQRSRDEWGDVPQELDPYMSRQAQRNDEWGQRDSFSPSNSASADPYTSQRRGYGERDLRDPYAENSYADDGMMSDGYSNGYDDAVDPDEDYARKRKGWRGFFRRGE